MDPSGPEVLVVDEGGGLETDGARDALAQEARAGEAPLQVGRIERDRKRSDDDRLDALDLPERSLRLQLVGACAQVLPIKPALELRLLAHGLSLLEEVD